MTVRVSNKTPLPVSAATYWRDIWLSFPFLQRLYTEVLGFSAVELVEQEGDHERGMKRRMRMHKPIQAPAAVQKILGATMVMEEHSEFDAAKQRWTYRVVPERLADRLDVSGSVTLGQHADGIEELFEDQLVFHMFGVGSIMEPFMARETKQGHTDRLAFIRRYIEEKQLR
jgi:hypothetical protein